MLKIHKISDIRSVEAYLLDNVKPYDIIIADDYNPYEIKRSLLNKREAGVVFDVQFTSILRLAKKYMADAGASYRYIDRTTSLFFISQLIRKNKSKLNVISAEFNEMIDNKYILDEIIELRQEGINSEKLKVVLENISTSSSQESQILKQKLSDLQVLIKSYENIFDAKLLNDEKLINGENLLHDGKLIDGGELLNDEKLFAVEELAGYGKLQVVEELLDDEELINKAIKLIENAEENKFKYRVFYVKTPESTPLELNFLRAVSKHTDVHILQDEITEDINLIEEPSRVLTVNSLKGRGDDKEKYLTELPGKSVKEDALIAVSYILNEIRTNTVKLSDIAIITGDEEGLEQIQDLLGSFGIAYNLQYQRYINKVFIYVDALLKYCSVPSKDKLLNLVKSGFAGFSGYEIDKALSFFSKHFHEIPISKDTVDYESPINKDSVDYEIPTNGDSVGYEVHTSENNVDCEFPINKDTMDYELPVSEAVNDGDIDLCKAGHFKKEVEFLKTISHLAQSLNNEGSLDEKLYSLENFFRETNLYECIERYCAALNDALQNNVDLETKIKSFLNEFFETLRDLEKRFCISSTEGFSIAKPNEFFEVAHLFLNTIFYSKNDILLDAVTVCDMNEMLFDNKKIVIVLETSKEVGTNHFLEFFTLSERQCIEKLKSDALIEKKESEFGEEKQDIDSDSGVPMHEKEPDKSEAKYFKSYLNKAKKANKLVVFKNEDADYQQNEMLEILRTVYRENYCYDKLTEEDLAFIRGNSLKSENEKLTKKINFKLNKNTVQRLYDISFKNNKYDVFMSPTGIESLGACPFRYFLDRGVGVCEEKTDFLDPRRRGEIYHKILEEAALYIANSAKKNKNGLLDFSKISEDEIKSVVDEAIKAEIIKTQNSQDEYRCLCIAKKAYPAAQDILSELKAGDIVSVMPEEKFKDGQRISSIKLRGRENLNVNISGKIDRVDVFASRKTRIIDYKTFENKLNTNILNDDWKPQLLIYLMAVLNNENLEFGSLFYKKITKDVKPEANIEALHFNGIILDDDEHLNEEFRNAADPSEFFAVTGDNEGVKKSRYAKGKFVDEDYILEKLKMLEERIYEYVDELIEGDIKPRKNRFKNACDYCKYMQICDKDNL